MSNEGFQLIEQGRGDRWCDEPCDIYPLLCAKELFHHHLSLYDAALVNICYTRVLGSSLVRHVAEWYGRSISTHTQHIFSFLFKHYILETYMHIKTIAFVCGNDRICTLYLTVCSVCME